MNPTDGFPVHGQQIPDQDRRVQKDIFLFRDEISRGEPFRGRGLCERWVNFEEVGRSVLRGYLYVIE